MLLREFRSGEVRTGRLKRKATAKDIVNITDNHKSTGVNLAHNGAHLRQLRQLDDYKNQLTVTMRKAALALDVGNTAANDLDNRFRNFLVMLADDDNLLFVIKADRKSIAGFGHNEEGQQRIQHRLDAEIGNAGQQEADIKNKACRADSHRIMLLDNRADDIRAAADNNSCKLYLLYRVSLIFAAI